MPLKNLKSDKEDRKYKYSYSLGYKMIFFKKMPYVALQRKIEKQEEINDSLEKDDFQKSKKK